MSDPSAPRDTFYQSIDGAISRIVHTLLTPSASPAEELKAARRHFSDARSRTLKLVDNLTPTQASFRPAPRAWSIAENLDHLLLTEKTYRAQIFRLIDLARAGTGTSIYLSLKEMNPSIGPIPRDMIPLFETPLRMMNAFIPHAVREALIRFPVIPSANPAVSDPRPQDIAVLRTELVSSLTATTGIFDAEDLPPHLIEMILIHPVLGSNNVVEIFRLMTAHEERHHGQIRAVLMNPRLPSL